MVFKQLNFKENERNWQLEKQYKINKILNDEKD
jgi:hypothetical protein